VPFQPWAREVYDQRQRSFTKDDPHTRCKPSGGARLFHTPYGFEILQLADTKEIVFLPVGSPHSWRVVHMDGRPLPENPSPSWYGTSVGRWEGDTLVVETRKLHPAQLYTNENDHLLYISPGAKLTERFTRDGPQELFYEFKVEDPVAYHQPWRAEMTFRAADGPLFEFACLEGNRSMENSLAGIRYLEKNAGRKGGKK
jgi:hypothetical protein